MSANLLANQLGAELLFHPPTLPDVFVNQLGLEVLFHPPAPPNLFANQLGLEVLIHREAPCDVFANQVGAEVLVSAVPSTPSIWYAYNYLNQPTLTSLLAFQMDGDSFFSPISLKHTGFAADGYLYAAGVQNVAQIASWSSETQSITRGPLPSFPALVLVIVSRASLCILDATQLSLPLWMLFYLADSYAYADNYLGANIGFLAAEASWANGLLTVSMTPDAGAVAQAPLVLTMDFVQDKVYAHTRS